MRRIILFIIIFSCSTFAFTQVRQHDDNFNTWLVYSGNHKFSKKFGLHLEYQLRRSNFLINKQQHLPRVGLIYYLNEQVRFTVGYAFIQSQPYGNFAPQIAFPEHRIWQQLQILNKYKWIDVQHRFRLEQRFVKLPLKIDEQWTLGDLVYSNRVRYLFKATFNIFSNKESSLKNIHLVAQNEVFINFGKNVKLNIFDQNRCYVAIGYRIPKLGSIELGYMEQSLLRADGVRLERNHTLQVAVISNLEFSKKAKK